MNEDDIYAFPRQGRVYPYVAPLGSDGKPSVSPPRIIFPSSMMFPLTCCVAAESRVSIQVDAYSTSIKEARALVEDALVALRPLNPTEVAAPRIRAPSTTLPHDPRFQGYPDN